MKTTEQKPSTSSAVQLKSAATPFFLPEESRDAFFGSYQHPAPFFNPASPNTGSNPIPSTIQAKLTIGAPGDVYEQEADAMADKVVQRLTTVDNKPSVQRKCQACATETIQPLRIQRMEKEEEPELQAKGGVPGLQTSADLESRLNATKGSGSPLPNETRTSMESSFGADFSNVRVHTNNSAVQMNQELGAQAFTHGSDIYFNSGKYDTGSSGGQHLLAHELTHTIQQSTGQVQAEGKTVNNEAGLEKEADEMGSAAVQTAVNVQKMGHEQGCDCPACMGKSAQLKEQDPTQTSRVQKKGHEKGCSCPGCSGTAIRLKFKTDSNIQPLQRKQTKGLMIQLTPANVVSHTFLGVSVSGGVDRGMSTQLNLVQTELQRQYDALPAAGKPASLQEYAGLSTITGWQNRTGNHGTGRAVDVNYNNQPYIATRTTEGGTTTYGGEQGNATPETIALRRPAVEVYDRAVSFVHATGASADVSNRRAGESATDVYRRFRLTSDALASYFSLAFHTNYDEVTRPPIINPETASEAALLRIPTTERKDEATGIADITAFMSTSTWLSQHPGYSLTPREQYFRILRDYETVRKPMQRGNPSTQPGNTRNPALGFLHMPEHFVVAMMDQGNLRWGACEFSARSNGDIHHFDMTAPHHTPVPAPAPESSSDTAPVQEKAIIQKQSNFKSPAPANVVQSEKNAAGDAHTMTSRIHATKSGSAVFPENNLLQMKPVESRPDDTSYSEGAFEISEPAILRDKDANWIPIKYKSDDPDLPTKTVKDALVPDDSFVGKNKSIPKGTKVSIDDVYIEKAANKTSNDKLKYVHVVDYGWTKVENIDGGLKNFSVGTMEAVKPLSTEPDHYTVAVEHAVILMPGNRYIEYEDKRVISPDTEITIDETFKGYYGDNASHNLAKVSYDGKTTFTSTGNYSSKAHEKKEPNKRKIVDQAAYERQEISSYIPDTGKGTMALGKHVIIGNQEKKSTGTYIEVFNVISSVGPDGKTSYTKGESLGWTNLLNLTQGFHKDLKGLNAMWDQVVPDERYDREKGKDTEGTAKFTGNQDMIKIVDSQGDIEHVSKEIWPSLNSMLSAANADGQALQLNTGFRDWDYQQAMISGGYQANPVGYSSHQRGIAVDLNNKTSDKTGGRNWWMERNAYKYGFVKTYKHYAEAHHWEYRPGEVVQPQEIEKDGKKYIKYTFATFSSNSSDIWSRNHVLDEVPATK